MIPSIYLLRLGTRLELKMVPTQVPYLYHVQLSPFAAASRLDDASMYYVVTCAAAGVIVLSLFSPSSAHYYFRVTDHRQTRSSFLKSGAYRRYNFPTWRHFFLRVTNFHPTFRFSYSNFHQFSRIFTNFDAFFHIWTTYENFWPHLSAFY